MKCSNFFAALILVALPMLAMEEKKEVTPICKEKEKTDDSFTRQLFIHYVGYQALDEERSDSDCETKDKFFVLSKDPEFKKDRCAKYKNLTIKGSMECNFVAGRQKFVYLNTQLEFVQELSKGEEETPYGMLLLHLKTKDKNPGSYVDAFTKIKRSTGSELGLETTVSGKYWKNLLKELEDSWKGSSDQDSD